MTEMEEQLKREYTKKETDRKCPACGAVMDYDPLSGGLCCPYCGHAEEITGKGRGPEGPAAELDFENAKSAGSCDWGAQKKMVICKSCGAQSVYDELEIANTCPYCGSNQVMEEKGEDTMAPGGVVPFALTAKEAAGRFASWIKRKLFCPRAAKDSAKPGAFQGVYLPFWTFDAGTESDYEAQYGIDRTVGHGDKKHTETIWHRTRGRYREQIDDEAVLGSSRYKDSLIRKVEPFNTADNKSYKPEYVAGFIAERYSIGLKEAWEKAKQYIKRKLTANIEEKVKEENRADHAKVDRIDTQYFNITYKYLLLPVWLSSYQYKGKVYHFMVNGQTGKAGGEIPVSPLRVVIAGFLVLTLFLACYEYWYFCLISAAAAAVLAIICRIKRL